MSQKVKKTHFQEDESENEYVCGCGVYTEDFEPIQYCMTEEEAILDNFGIFYTYCKEGDIDNAKNTYLKIKKLHHFINVNREMSILIRHVCIKEQFSSVDIQKQLHVADWLLELNYKISWYDANVIYNHSINTSTYKIIREPIQRWLKQKVEYFESNNTCGYEPSNHFPIKLLIEKINSFD